MNQISTLFTFEKNVLLLGDEKKYSDFLFLFISFLNKTRDKY